jgi:nucleoside-diphosphate-sugar epimerase
VSRILVTGASGFIGRAVVAELAAAGHEVRAATRRPPEHAATEPNEGFAKTLCSPSLRAGRGLDGGTRCDGTALPAAPIPPTKGMIQPTHVETTLHGDLDAGIDWRPLVAGIEFVVHLAGIAHSRPDRASRVGDEERHDRVNHRATANLAHAAFVAGVRRFVFISSVRAQSGAASERVLTEADEPRPVDAYGRSKLAAEVAVSRSGVEFTILRPVLVYGPGVKGNLCALMRLAARPVPLPFGAVTNRRSLLSLHNLVSAIAHVLAHTASCGETYLVADPQPLSLRDIVTALRLGIGRPSRLFAMPPALIRLGLTALGLSHNWDQLCGSLVIDPAKLIATGWRPHSDTATALAAMMRASLAPNT